MKKFICTLALMATPAFAVNMAGVYLSDCTVYPGDAPNQCTEFVYMVDASNQVKSESFSKCTIGQDGHNCTPFIGGESSPGSVYFDSFSSNPSDPYQTNFTLENEGNKFSGFIDSNSTNLNGFYLSYPGVQNNQVFFKKIPL